MAVTDRAIREAVLRVLAARSDGATCCPSDVARAVADDAGWRALMPRVRAVAAAMAAEGALRVTQNGAPVDPGTVRGPIRLGLR